MLLIGKILGCGLARDVTAVQELTVMISDLLGRWKLDPEIVDAMALAVDVLESEEQAYLWLTRPNIHLEGELPLFLLVTGRAVIVRDLLSTRPAPKILLMARKDKRREDVHPD
ncbi:MAG: DUF2384 domain-containing protein [Betaproteobacteria bacterium]|nr:DUF2384 domain-containing protein [Betaproteobacteria bacterium]